MAQTTEIASTHGSDQDNLENMQIELSGLGTCIPASLAAKKLKITRPGVHYAYRQGYLRGRLVEMTPAGPSGTGYALLWISRDSIGECRRSDKRRLRLAKRPK